MTLRTQLTRLALAGATLALAAPLRAQTVATDVGTVYQTSGLSSAATTGEDMAGMSVTAYFSDGAQSTAVWGDLGEGAFGARSSLFRLALPAETNTGTMAYVWQLQNLGAAGLSRLVISGASGRTAFDILDEEEFTPNSALGIPLAISPDYDEEGNETASPYAAHALVTYRNAVAVGAAAPLLDLFEQVDLLLGAPLVSNDVVLFHMDTDTVGEGASLDPRNNGGNGGGNPGGPTSAVPEPATLALLAGGLATLGIARRRRIATV